MKQCAGCGKRFPETQPNCPSCFSRPWILIPADGSPASLPEHAVPCPECGLMSAPGVARCANCRGKLRPRVLEWLCYLGLLGAVAGVGFLGWQAVAGVSFQGTQLVHRRDFWNLVDIPVALAVGYVSWGLLRGQFQALKLARLLVFIAPGILLLEILILCLLRDMLLASAYAGSFVLRLFAAIPLWFLFNSAAVADYCAVGKPAEVNTTQRLFLEQTGVSRTRRTGDAITQHLE